MRLARLLHSAIACIASGAQFDAGVLNSIKAASENIINGNRDATDAELLGLENLIDQLVPASAAEESVPLDQNAALVAGDATNSEVQASETGGAPAPQEPESVTAVAPPETSSEVPVEPTPQADEQLTEAPQPAPIPPHEELFQDQADHEIEHVSDDDGA
jgi:hypothetical protein